MSASSGVEDADPSDPGPGTETASPHGSVTSVKVAVRVRPLIPLERGQGCQAVMFGNSDNNQVVTGDNRCFRFDHVFGEDSTQEEVYRSTTLPLVERCLDGFNATVLAYGQTGSGKTWTVGNGYSVNGSPEDAGIIPRAVVDIFKRVEELRGRGIKASVSASFLEVINEEIRDLVGGVGTKEGSSGDGNPGGLPLRENLQGEVTVAGLSQHEISGPKDLAALLERGALCRATASTNMNAHSSRSHAICTLTFEVVQPATEEAAETATLSRFHLVDLAGSERVKKTGAEGQRLREGININKGLLALGNVISALSENGGSSGGGGSAAVGSAGAANAAVVGAAGGHHVHVPYRDSKLTRLLQSSLGGNAHTVMIACISPADSNMAESTNTLRYAGRAMRIKNTAVKNEGATGPPVSYAEVVALRKEVRVLQVELMQARLTGLGNFGLTRAGVSGESSSVEGGRSGPSESSARAAVQEAAELRRGKAALERRVLDATRHATTAVEGEMSARLESDRWRLRCEQVVAVLKDVAPNSLDSLPSWATGKDAEAGTSDASLTENCSESSGEPAVSSSEKTSSVGSLERELRQRVFELQEQIFHMEGRLSLAGDTARVSSSGAAVKAVKGVESLGSFDSDGGAGERDTSLALADVCGHDVGDDQKGGGEISLEGSDGNVEEIRLVDQEIEDKERELLLKAEQARAYEAMKGQFEGLLGRLQGEVSSLQSERDGLLQKISSSSAMATSGSSSSRGSAGSGKADGGAAFARMKARIAELEARIKENRKKLAEHQRAERERAAAAKEVERLKAEVGGAKTRRAELQRVHREASSRFMKETREHQLKEARMRRDGQRMQWQVKKLQESHDRTQATLKRKMEEHSIAMRKMRKLQSQKPQGVRGGVDGAGRAGGGDPALREAKRAELATWLASEIEEATAVQRAKRALKAQLELRANAARMAQQLREEMEANSGRIGDEGGEGKGSKPVTERIEDLEERVAAASKIIQSLQTFLMSADRNSSATGTRTASGTGAFSPPGSAGNARWARLRTPWDNKTALSILLGEAVKAKVIGLDLDEASSLKDDEIRDLSREIEALRSAALAIAEIGGRSAATVAMEAALAKAETEVMAAVGVEAPGRRGDSKILGVVKGSEAIGERGYDKEERSFVEISESEDEDEEGEELDSDDEDEEWLPDDAVARRKRSSNQNVVAVITSGGSSSPKPAAAAAAAGGATGDAEVGSEDHPRGPKGARSSRGSSVGGGGGKSDRCSSGSAASEHLICVVNSAEEGLAEDVDWDNLGSRTVVQLKDLLRTFSLPVTGKKDVLIERLKTSHLAGHATSRLLEQRSSSPSSSVAVEDGSGDTVGDVNNDDRENDVRDDRDGTEAPLPTSDVDSRVGGANEQETLRERIKARVHARAVAREVEATRNRASSDAVKAAVDSNGGSLPPPSRSRLHVQDTGSASAVPSYRGTSPGVAMKAKNFSKASSDSSARSSMLRKPLGVLVQGSSPRVGSSINSHNVAPDLSDSKGRKEKKSEPMAVMKAEGNSGDAHARTAFSSGTTKKDKTNSSEGAGPKRAPTGIASGAKKLDSSGTGGDRSERARFSSSVSGGNSGSGNGSGSVCGPRHGSSEAVDENASREVRASVGGHRRVKSNVAVKSTVQHVPSFLKPTKSSGAHTSAAHNARSGGGQ